MFYFTMYRLCVRKMCQLVIHTQSLPLVDVRLVAPLPFSRGWAHSPFLTSFWILLVAHSGTTGGSSYTQPVWGDHFERLPPPSGLGAAYKCLPWMAFLSKHGLGWSQHKTFEYPYSIPTVFTLFSEQNYAATHISQGKWVNGLMLCLMLCLGRLKLTLYWPVEYRIIITLYYSICTCTLHW